MINNSLIILANILKTNNIQGWWGQVKVPITAIFWETELGESKIEICTPLYSTFSLHNKNMERKVHYLTTTSKIFWSDNKWKKPKCPIIGEWQWLKRIMHAC